jgi:hypothetical protein
MSTRIAKLAFLTRKREKSGMGIRNLRQRLEPYGEQADLEGRSFVIDGSSLAWHTCRLVQAKMRNKKNPWELPSYRLLGETTLQWLDELRANGNNMYIS